MTYRLMRRDMAGIIPGYEPKFDSLWDAEAKVVQLNLTRWSSNIWWLVGDDDGPLHDPCPVSTQTARPDREKARA